MGHLNRYDNPNLAAGETAWAASLANQSCCETAKRECARAPCIDAFRSIRSHRYKSNYSHGHRPGIGCVVDHHVKRLFRPCELANAAA